MASYKIFHRKIVGTADDVVEMVRKTTSTKYKKKEVILRETTFCILLDCGHKEDFAGKPNPLPETIICNTCRNKDLYAKEAKTFGQIKDE